MEPLNNLFSLEQKNTTIDIKYTINDILVDNNIELLSKKFTCCICFELIHKKEVFQCKEGHWACKECWIQSLNVTKACMQCRVKVTSLDVLSRNRYIEDEFNDKMVYCPNRLIQNGDKLVVDNTNGCKETVTINHLESHLTSCQFKYQKCKFTGNGCTHIDRLIKLSEHTDKCGYQLVTCKHCNRSNILKSKLSTHHSVCPKMKVKCTQCNSVELIERDKLQQHIEIDCKDTIIHCKYNDDGCNDTFKRSELPKHLININHTVYMGNLIDKQALKLKELSIENNEIRNQLSNKYKNKWIIKNFSNKLKDNPYDRLHSSSFNIGTNPFRLYIRPKGEKAGESFLSIFLSFDKFSKPITTLTFFTLINNDKSKNLTFNFQHSFGVSESRGYLQFKESDSITFENGWLSDKDDLTIEFSVRLLTQELISN